MSNKEKDLDEKTLDNEDFLENEEELEEVDQVEEEASNENELLDSLLRLQADFANFRKRTEKDKKDIIAYANEGLICKILPVLDNFQRALASVENEDGFYDGVKMIYDQLFNILKENGLREIDSNGSEFDPNFHHAVLLEDNPDFEEGHIIETLEVGYILNDKVIRPSVVKVAK